MTVMTTKGRQLVSTLQADGTMVLELQEKTFPEPRGNQVLVKMEAAPINPSDLFLMTAGADLENADYARGNPGYAGAPWLSVIPPGYWVDGYVMPEPPLDAYVNGRITKWLPAVHEARRAHHCVLIDLTA